MTDQRSPLIVGQILTGALFNEPMRVETVQSNGTASWIVGLVGANSERFRKDVTSDTPWHEPGKLDLYFWRLRL
jgi:hypothetical protein